MGDGMTFQLLPNEAKLVEALRDCPDVAANAIKIGITREAAYYLLKRLVDFGIIHRSGNKRHYCHKVMDVPYEIVQHRGRPEPEESIGHDKLIKESVNIELTEEQLFYLKNHRTLKRSVLARHLGITKLQLNFALIKVGK